MKVYHASTIPVESPDTKHSRDKLDFGKGFYLTEIREQAIKYAERFTVRNKEAYINEYDLDEDLHDFTVKQFLAYDEEWLDYVTRCRKGMQTEPLYDAVSGGIANDKVFNTIDLYFAGVISKAEALGRLKYEVPNHQLCILNENLIRKHLHFIKAIKL